MSYNKPLFSFLLSSTSFSYSTYAFFRTSNISALERYDQMSRYVIDGRYRIDSNLVENGQRPVALGRKNYLFCGNDDAAEDAAVIYTMTGCCKATGVNVYDWLVYFLDHVHDYDCDYSRDLAELLPGALKAKGLVKDVGASPTTL